MSRKTQRYSKKFKAEAVRTVLENQLYILKKATVDFAQESLKNTR